MVYLNRHIYSKRQYSRKCVKIVVFHLNRPQCPVTRLLVFPAITPTATSEPSLPMINLFLDRIRSPLQTAEFSRHASRHRKGGHPHKHYTSHNPKAQKHHPLSERQFLVLVLCQSLENNHNQRIIFVCAIRFSAHLKLQLGFSPHPSEPYSVSHHAINVHRTHNTPLTSAYRFHQYVATMFRNFRQLWNM